MKKENIIKTKKQRKYLIIFWSLFLLPLILLVTVFTLISTGRMGFMPIFEDLENPQNNLASQVFSADGELLGPWYDQNRTYVDFDDISENIVNALLATEDIRFRNHAGIDARGLARVIVKSVILQQDAGGGSTITQQLAKNLFPRDTISYRFGISRKINLGITKFKEWVTAVKLERNYTKDEILVMYLNTVDFGSHSYGIKTAARTFFNTTPDSLKIEEAALLVGVLKAPSWFSPVRNPERATGRRNHDSQTSNADSTPSYGSSTPTRSSRSPSPRWAAATADSHGRRCFRCSERGSMASRRLMCASTRQRELPRRRRCRSVPIARN